MELFYNLFLYSQSIEDAIRYSRSELSGTARYVAMGGAFNALGGDFSAIDNNPAAAAVFNISQLGGTINSINNQISANYFENSNNINSESSKLNQFGIVFALKSNLENDFTKICFAYNYQNNLNFDSKYNIIGTNNLKSLDDYFLFHADGIEFGSIKTYDDETLSESYQYLGNQLGFSSQQAFLGYQGYIINPYEENDDNTKYFSNRMINSSFSLFVAFLQAGIEENFAI